MPSTNKRYRHIPWSNKRKSKESNSSDDKIYSIPNFYQSKMWRSLRNAFFNSHAICKYCQIIKGKIVPGKVVDHIVGVRFGGAELDETNLQTLCTKHHNIKSGYEAHKRCDPDTAQIYPNHPLNKKTNK